MDLLNSERALSSSVIVEGSFILTFPNGQKFSRHELLNIELSVLLNPRKLVEISLEDLFILFLFILSLMLTITEKILFTIKIAVKC